MKKILVIDDDSAGQRCLRRTFETIRFRALLLQEMARWRWMSPGLANQASLSRYAVHWELQQQINPCAGKLDRQ
jgi:hypothetical protein